MSKKETKKQVSKKVTIEVGAAEYAMLARYAKALNGVEWTGGDNTVATVIENFCLCLDDKAVFENIVNGIDTKARPASKADERRRRMVQNALADAEEEAKAKAAK